MKRTPHTQSKEVSRARRLTMKANLDDFRQSPVQGMIKRIKQRERGVAYPPTLTDDETLFGREIATDLAKFKKMSDAIAANGYDARLNVLEDRA